MSHVDIHSSAESASNAGQAQELAHQSHAGSTTVLAAPASAVRTKFQGVMSTKSFFADPSIGAADDESASVPLGRRVGFRYLTQFGLTSLPLVILDLALLVLVLASARQLMFMFDYKLNLDLTDCFLPLAVGFLLICAELGLYPGIRLSPVEEFRRLSMAVTSIFAVWVLGMAMMSDGLERQRCLFLALAYGMYLVSLPICRGALRRILANRSWWGFPTLVCGNDATVVQVHDWLSSNRRLGLRPVGVIANREDLELDGDEPWYAGAWENTSEIAEAKRAYWAVVVPPEDSRMPLDKSIAANLTTMPYVHILSDPADFTEGWARHQQFEGLSGVHIQQNLMLPFPRLTKRCMDLVAALIGVILLLPLLFYVAMAVKLSSRGPILYGHDRIGKNGRHFKAWKFRTMFENSSDVLEYYLEQHPELREEWEKDHKLRHDPRVTRIGRFIRKTSIDELPQLWNVIRGDMSLVGPRPIVTAEIVKYGPYYSLYTMVTPGITGVWQVCGRNNTTYDERVQLDSYYVRNWSPWLDMYLLLRTVRIVLFADGAY